MENEEPDAFNIVVGRMKAITHSSSPKMLREVLGIGEEAYACARRTGIIPEQWTTKLFNLLGISPAWLLRGEEPMYVRGGRLAWSFPEMLEQPETSPVVVPLYKTSFYALTPQKKPKLVCLERTVLSSVLVPNGTIVFIDNGPESEGFSNDGKSLVGVDTTQCSLTGGDCYALYFECSVMFWTYQDGKEFITSNGRRLVFRPGLRQTVGSLREMERYLLGKVIWYFHDFRRSV